jgi:hypothetical protein
MTEFINYKDIDGNEFVIPELAMVDDETTEEFADRERDSISRALAIALTLMVEMDLNVVPTFAVAGLDVVFSLDRDEAPDSLDRCIHYFTEIEDYEKCAKLIKLKPRL